MCLNMSRAPSLRGELQRRQPLGVKGAFQLPYACRPHLDPHATPNQMLEHVVEGRLRSRPKVAREQAHPSNKTSAAAGHQYGSG